MTDPANLSVLTMPNPSCVFFATSDEALGRHAAALEADGTLGSAAVVSDPDALPGTVDARGPDLVVADLGEDPESVLDLLEKLATPRPQLVVIGSPDQGRTVLRAMRMGVREYFEEPPGVDDLRRVIGELAAEIVPEAAPQTSARVVAVMGAKGGAGTTVVACQLAASLRAGGERTTVVDLNLPLGDVALYFDVEPAHTIADIAHDTRRLDATYLHTLMQGPPEGVQILASPSRAEEAELVQGAHVEDVITLLRREFDWVILDVSRIFGEPTVRALDLADQILLVTLMDVSTLHHSRQLLELLERLGHTGRRVRLIANRHASDGPIHDKEVADFLDHELDFRIPNDHPTASATTNHGASMAQIAPRSAIARAFAELHRNLYRWADREPPPEEPPGLLDRLLARLRRR